MRVFIGTTEVSIQIMPNKKETQDETLDTFSFACVVSDKDTAYDPNTPIYIKNDDATTVELELMLVSDNVEVASFNPVKYLHNISAVQNTRKFSKQLIRNSVFSQPFAKEKSSYNAATFSLAGMLQYQNGEYQGQSYFRYKNIDIGDGYGSTGHPNYVSEALHLTQNEKAKNVCVKIDVRCVKSQWNSSPQWDNSSWLIPTKWSSLVSNGLLDTIPTSYILKYDDDNGDPQTYNLTASDFEGNTLDFLLGKKIRCPKIENLINNGCNNFEIVFPQDSTEFLDKDQYSTGSSGITQGDFLSLVIVQIRIVAETYYHTAYDILETISQRHQQKYKVENFSGTEYEVVKREPLWDYEPSLITTLQGVYPPNLTFTQLTAFECCAEVFRLLDATFTLSTDGKLDIEYFNDWDTKKYNSATGDIKMTGRNLAIGEDRYTNGLITYYQDGRAEVQTVYMSMRNEGLGIPTNGSFGVKLPFPIQMINNAYAKTGIIEGNNNTNIALQIDFSIDYPNNHPILMDMGSFDLDISFFMVEETLWAYLPTTNMHQNDETRVRYHHNTIPFKQGGDFIDFSLKYTIQGLYDTYSYTQVIADAFNRYCGLPLGAMGTWNIYVWDVSNYTNMFVKFNYTAYVDGRTKIETLRNKYDGETLVDQYNGAVDLNKMGVNLLGLSLKMGEPTLNISQKICNWEDRIQKGEIYIYDNAYWIANVCAYQLLPNNKVKTTVSFVKNFNALSLNTRLLREKRLSNVSSALTQKSEDNIVEYVYVAPLSSPLPSITPEPIIFYKNKFRALLSKSLGSKNSDDVNAKVYTAVFSGSTSSYIPLHKYGAGNMICFEMSFDDPKVAGYKTTKKKITDSNSQVFSYYYTESVYYTDSEGFVNYVAIAFCDDTIAPSSSYPEVDNFYSSVIGYMHHYEVLKQPNEVFALNYQLCFLPLDYQNAFVGEEFINNNAFVNDDFDITEPLYLYYSFGNFTYSQLDRKAHGSYRTKITSSGCLTTPITNYYFGTFIYEEIPYPLDMITAYAIARKNGDILFAFNGSPNSETMTTILFYTRQTRIK